MFRWILPALLSGLIAFLSFLPLGWAAKLFMTDEVKVLAPDLSFHGNIWKGTLSGLPIFDSANIKIAPLSLKASLQSGEGQNYVSAEIMPNSAKDVELHVNLETVPFTDGRLQGLRGKLVGQITELKFEGNNCVSASGTLRTDVLQRNGGNLQWTGPELSGPVTCEDGALIAALTGRDSQQAIEANLRLSPDYVYRADISVQTTRAEAEAVLPLFGFTRSGRNFILTEQGRWR